MMLINASNLHVGGGVQVAASIIGELSLMEDLPNDLHIWASSEVHANLKKSGYDLSAFPSYEIVDIFGANPLQFNKLKRLYCYDAVLTIFGPLYVFGMRGITITGFAQAWIIYPSAGLPRSSSFLNNIKAHLKFKIQSFFFKRSDVIIAELEHVRDKLIDLRICNPENAKIVYNCLSSIYTDTSRWEAVSIPTESVGIKIGFVGRNYPHKNTAIFPAVRNLLKNNYNIDADFYVTFTELEWAACSDEFQRSVINVGELYVSQCPLFYKEMDAVIFPSLLECFSATPLEAMAMLRPLFASDRPFNRDICGDYAYYFDPMSPENAAQVIAKYYINLKTYDKSTKLEEAQKHAINFSNPTVRARKHLDFLIDAANLNRINTKD